MGLFRRNRTDDTEWIVGTARVTSASSPHSGDGSAMFMNGVFHFVVEVPGVPAFAVEERRITRTRRWPQPGMVLPARVSRTDPPEYEIDFDAIPNWDDAARQQAEMQAAMMRGEAVPGAMAGGMLGGMAGNVQFIGGSPADLPPEKLAKLEAFLGQDLNGDGVIGGTPAAAAPAPAGWAPPSVPAADDRLAQLERLARLHASGALTDDEFAREKARLLG